MPPVPGRRLPAFLPVVADDHGVSSGLAVGHQPRFETLRTATGPAGDQLVMQYDHVLLAVGEDQRLGASPGQLEHAAETAGLGSADGPGTHHVTGLHVASGHGVVRQLLAHVPVEVLEVGAADPFRIQARPLEPDLEMDVVGAGAAALQVGRGSGSCTGPSVRKGSPLAFRGGRRVAKPREPK